MNNPKSASTLEMTAGNHIREAPMSIGRKILYSLVTLTLVFLGIEGTGRLIWWRLESRALRARKVLGEQVLRNDAINFLKQSDGIYGYSLKPGDYPVLIHITKAGFLDQEETPVARRPGYLRVVCLGESTTFGTNGVDNYPAHLRQILRHDGRGFDGYEVMNGGVPGWVSDQIALRVNHQIASYHPDVVVLYVGWNDFQSYDPLGPPPQSSYFDASYGKGRVLWAQGSVDWLKSVALASAWYDAKFRSKQNEAVPTQSAVQNTPAIRYRFLVQNLDRIVSKLRTANPKVRIFVCTLVGRWPQSMIDESGKQIPGTWWMKVHNVDYQGAASFVRELNEQLRDFARTRNVDLIDMAAVFENLDRTRLQYDFAHMTSEGYELMAWTVFSELQKSGVLQGQDEPRHAQLLDKYQLPTLSRANEAQ